MVKWLIATVIALALFSGLMPFLRRFGIGRLPGDFSFTLFGREISLPIMSTVLLSLLAAGIAHLLWAPCARSGQHPHLAGCAPREQMLERAPALGQ